MNGAQMNFGPWAPGLTDAERIARTRELRALVAAFAGGSRRPLVAVLTRAERDPAALAEAAVLLDQLPTRWFRNIVSTLGALGGVSRSMRARDAA